MIEGPWYPRQGSTDVQETALRRDVVRSHATHMPLPHLRGQHGSQDTGRDEKHARVLRVLVV